MREVWISNEGVIFDGINHLIIAQEIFPKAKNPELACEKAGYLKVTTLFNGQPLLIKEYGEVTQAQINRVDQLWEEHYAERG